MFDRTGSHKRAPHRRECRAPCLPYEAFLWHVVPLKKFTWCSTTFSGLYKTSEFRNPVIAAKLHTVVTPSEYLCESSHFYQAWLNHVKMRRRWSAYVGWWDAQFVSCRPSRDLHPPCPVTSSSLRRQQQRHSRRQSADISCPACVVRPASVLRTSLHRPYRAAPTVYWPTLPRRPAWRGNCALRYLCEGGPTTTDRTPHALRHPHRPPSIPAALLRHCPVPPSNFCLLTSRRPIPPTSTTKIRRAIAIVLFCRPVPVSRSASRRALPRWTVPPSNFCRQSRPLTNLRPFVRLRISPLLRIQKRTPMIAACPRRAAPPVRQLVTTRLHCRVPP